MGDQVADRLNLKEIQGPVELSKSHNEKAFGKGIGIVAKIEDEDQCWRIRKEKRSIFFGKCHGIWQSRYKDL